MDNLIPPPSLEQLREGAKRPFSRCPEICKTRVLTGFKDRNGKPIRNGDAVRYWCSGRRFMGEYRATKHREFSECESRVAVFKDKRKSGPKVFCNIGLLGMIGACPLSFVAQHCEIISE